MPARASCVPSGDHASAYIAPDEFRQVMSGVVMGGVHTSTSPFLPPVARRLPSGDHASAYTWVEASGEFKGVTPETGGSEALVLPAGVQAATTRMKKHKGRIHLAWCMRNVFMTVFLPSLLTKRKCVGSIKEFRIFLSPLSAIRHKNDKKGCTLEVVQSSYNLLCDSCALENEG